jgi:hypothetical protein
MARKDGGIAVENMETGSMNSCKLEGEDWKMKKVRAYFDK